MSELTEERLDEIERRCYRLDDRRITEAEVYVHQLAAEVRRLREQVTFERQSAAREVHRHLTAVLGPGYQTVPELQAEVERLRKLLDGEHHKPGAFDRMSDWAQQMENERDEARAEVERLRAELHR